MVESKVKSLQARSRREYRRTDEYKAERVRLKQQETYQKVRRAFAKAYDVTPDEYDHIYDVFRELRDETYLKNLERKKQQEEVTRPAYEQEQRRYYEQARSNYSYSGFGGYAASASHAYTQTEQIMLKDFYRALSRKYHPDLNPDPDTTAHIQLLNKLGHVGATKKFHVTTERRKNYGNEQSPSGCIG